VICSACGYENQAGNRFCGMCGTPLPHRPLTAPGAHGTYTLTRMPLENGKPGREPIEPPEQETDPSAPPSRGVKIQIPSPEPPPARSSNPSSPDVVPETSLDEYVKNFRYVPPADPAETTMRGETQALQTEVLAVSDAATPVPTVVTTAAGADPISETEDVDERLGLAELTPDERHDRPRFLDLNEPTVPPEKLEVQVPAIGGPSFLGLRDALPVAAPSPDSEADEPHGKAWTWVAVAALLAFVALGVLEWRSQGGENNYGPVEVVKTKIRGMWRRSSPAPQAAGSAEGEPPKPTTQVEEQTKPKPQGQSLAANSGAPTSTTAGNPPVTDTNPAANAAILPQNALPGASVNAAQPAGEQKPVQPKATPLSNRSQAVTSDPVQAAAATPKPKAQPDDPAALAKRPVLGQNEVAKANDASDAVAAAAWLWRATAKGNPEAPLRLADMYVKGDGVPRSCEQALVLLNSAATKENAPARNRLAAMYSSGTCVQRNLIKAYSWLNSALAADPNSQWAQQNRDAIWKQMTPEERADVPPPH